MDLAGNGACMAIDSMSDLLCMFATVYAGCSQHRSVIVYQKHIMV